MGKISSGGIGLTHSSHDLDWISWKKNVLRTQILTFFVLLSHQSFCKKILLDLEHPQKFNTINCTRVCEQDMNLLTILAFSVVTTLYSCCAVCCDNICTEVMFSRHVNKCPDSKQHFYTDFHSYTNIGASHRYRQTWRYNSLWESEMNWKQTTREINRKNWFHAVWHSS